MPVESLIFFFTEMPVESLKYVLVFLVMLVTDYIWSEWMKSVAEKQAFKAGIFSVGTVLTGAFFIAAFIENPKYLIPACLGAFIGTYISVAIDKNGKKEKH